MVGARTFVASGMVLLLFMNIVSSFCLFNLCIAEEGKPFFYVLPAEPPKKITTAYPGKQPIPVKNTTVQAPPNTPSKTTPAAGAQGSPPQSSASTAPSQKPNLIVSSVSFDPKCFVDVGSPVIVAVKIKNIGNGPTSGDVVTKVVDQALCTSVPWIFHDYDAIPAGSEREHQFTLTPCKNAIMEMKAMVDPDNKIVESTKTDNSNAASVAKCGVDISRGGVTKADIEATGLTFSPANPKVGDKVTVTATLRNNGPSISNPTMSRVTNPGCMAGTFAEKPFETPMLKPGESQTFSYPVFACAPTDDNYFIFKADYSDWNNDPKKDNNVIYKQLPVTGGSSSGGNNKADLVVEYFSMDKKTLKAGDNPAITEFIKNVGNVAAPPSIATITTYKKIVNQKTMQYTWMQQGIARKWVLSEIPPGGQTGTQADYAFVCTLPGEYKFVLRADVNGQVGELNEENNEAEIEGVTCINPNIIANNTGGTDTTGTGGTAGTGKSGTMVGVSAWQVMPDGTFKATFTNYAGEDINVNNVIYAFDNGATGSKEVGAISKGATSAQISMGTISPAYALGAYYSATLEFRFTKSGVAYTDAGTLSGQVVSGGSQSSGSTGTGTSGTAGTGTSGSSGSTGTSGTQTKAKPNLIVESIALDKTCLTQGQPIVATITIKNTGTAATSGAIPVRVTPNNCQQAETLSEPSLAAGASESFQYTYPACMNAIAEIKAEADPDNAIAEANEADNAKSAQISPCGVDSSRGGATVADIELTGLTFSNNNPAVGDQIYVTVTLRNNGPSRSNPTMSRVTHPAAMALDNYFPTKPFETPSLNVRETQTFTYPIFVRAPVDDNYFTAEADYSNWNNDPTPDNNKMSKTLSVRSASGSGAKPDLKVTLFSADKTELASGETASFMKFIKNNGNVAAPASTATIIVRRNGMQYGAVQYWQLSSLPPGGETGDNGGGTYFTCGAAKGTFIHTLTADANNQVDDADRENNVASVSITCS